jgi:hypothetical protein
LSSLGHVQTGSWLKGHPEIRLDIEKFVFTLLVIEEGCLPALGDGDV